MPPNPSDNHSVTLCGGPLDGAVVDVIQFQEETRRRTTGGRFVLYRLNQQTGRWEFIKYCE